MLNSFGRNQSLTQFVCHGKNSSVGKKLAKLLSISSESSEKSTSNINIIVEATGEEKKRGTASRPRQPPFINQGKTLGGLSGLESRLVCCTTCTAVFYTLHCAPRSLFTLFTGHFWIVYKMVAVSAWWHGSGINHINGCIRKINFQNGGRGLSCKKCRHK